MRLFPEYLNYYKKNSHFLSVIIKMSGKSVNFGDKKTNKTNFYKNKKNYLR